MLLDLLALSEVLQGLDSVGDAHALEELTLRHRSLHYNLLVLSGYLCYLLEVDVGREVNVTHVVKNLTIVLDQLVVPQASEGVAEAVCLTVVYDEGHALAQLNNVADVLGDRGSLGTDLDGVTYLEVFLGLFVEELLWLKLDGGVLGGSVGDDELKLV